MRKVQEGAGRDEAVALLRQISGVEETFECFPCPLLPYGERLIFSQRADWVTHMTEDHGIDPDNGERRAA